MYDLALILFILNKPFLSEPAPQPLCVVVVNSLREMYVSPELPNFLDLHLHLHLHSISSVRSLDITPTLKMVHILLFYSISFYSNLVSHFPFFI